MNWDRIITGTFYAVAAFWVFTNASQINKVVTAGGGVIVSSFQALSGGTRNPMTGPL